MKRQCKMIRRISILTTAVKMRIMKRAPGWACIRRRYSSTIPDLSEQPCMILRSNACLTVLGMTQTYCTITATEGTASQGVHENTERFANWSFESSRRHAINPCSFCARLFPEPWLRWEKSIASTSRISSKPASLLTDSQCGLTPICPWV